MGQEYVTVRVPKCSIEGCPAPAGTRGWCATHYTRWRRHGDPTVNLWLKKQGEPYDPAERQQGLTKGPEHPNSKLTARQVMEIRQRYAQGDVTQTQLSAEYEVSGVTIHKIVRGKMWKGEA